MTGVVKVNIDAALDVEVGRMGFGWILQDDREVFRSERQNMCVSRHVWSSGRRHK